MTKRSGKQGLWVMFAAALALAIAGCATTTKADAAPKSDHPTAQVADAGVEAAKSGGSEHPSDHPSDHPK